MPESGSHGPTPLARSPPGIGPILTTHGCSPEPRKQPGRSTQTISKAMKHIYNKRANGREGVAGNLTLAAVITAFAAIFAVAGCSSPNPPPETEPGSLPGRPGQM